MHLLFPDGHSRSCQTSKMDLFAKIVKVFMQLFIFAKNSNTSLHSNDVPIKIRKPKADNFAVFLNHAYNESVIYGILPSVFNNLTSNKSIKKNSKI